ncbi:MAG: hypothetical protein IIA41_06320 [SAR324 cluster bacterium]|nr:hypothetical protein [SAR324 cluster bacterium]
MRHDPRSARFLGRRGIALLLTGALLPLLDYTPALLLAQDSIAFLSRPRWMHSLLYGALWTAGGSLLVSFTAGPRWALYLRLPFQLVLIAWAFWVTRPDTGDS